MIRTLRWLLVAPMAVFGWSIAFSGTLALHSLIFMFCPPEQQISGMCTAPWAATTEGILIIKAQRYRSQEQNRQDAVDRLVKMIQKAIEAPRHRRVTRPTAASKKRRLATKRRRGDLKRRRKVVRQTGDDN